MSLQQSYLRFLSSPRSAAISNATTELHYVTTGHTITGEAIISHLNNQKHQMEKKVEKVLAAIEARDSLVLEVETTVLFKSSGGSFLPNLDDNFIVDQTATFPLIHIVNFDNGLIGQIRLYWDQGTLLKQMGVIGRTGRNWPIKDGVDQVKLIQKSISVISLPRPESERISEAPPTRDRGQSNASVTSTHSIRPTPDPHSTLSLFSPREVEDERILRSPTGPPPRTSAKPPPRDLEELFVPSEVESSHKHGEEGPNDSIQSIKMDPRKYSHFDMTEESPAATKSTPAKKYPRVQSHWDFADFSTPEKKQLRPRPDFQSQFTLTDDSPAASNKVVKELPADRKAAVNSLSSSHWDFEEVEQLGGRNRTIYKTAGDGMGGRKGGGSIRGADDEGEKTIARKKENKPLAASEEAPKGSDSEKEGEKNVDLRGGGKKQIYKTAGDGMGGRKGAPSIWATDEAETNELLGGGSRTIYKTAGDGMGGRKASGSIWGTDADEGSSGRTKTVPRRNENEPSTEWGF